MEEAKRTAPIVRDEVALIPLDTPCQIHPLIAQQWRGRLKDKVVIAANRGYRPGWVHFAARSASGRNLIDFLAKHRPDGADSRYGNGHAQATGGALPLEQWNSFITGSGSLRHRCTHDRQVSPPSSRHSRQDYGAAGHEDAGHSPLAEEPAP
jgi:single-stranded-DNA-specific exonuclease